MSPERASQLVRPLVAAINAGDAEAMESLCDADAELWPLLANITGEPFRGRSAVRDWYSEARESLTDIEFALLELTDLGEHAVVICRDRRHERSTGGVLEVKWAMAIRAREGKLAWARAFQTEREAREAVAARE